MAFAALAVVVSMTTTAVSGFTVLKRDRLAPTSHSKLFESMMEVKMPSENEAVSLGIREWPQQLKKGAWSEKVDDGKMSCVYVLDGSASVSVTLLNEAGEPKTDLPSEHVIVPGSLLETMGPAQLEFEATDDEILILTPDYQQGTLLAAAGALFIVVCGALITGSFGLGGN